MEESQIWLLLMLIIFVSITKKQSSNSKEKSYFINRYMIVLSFPLCECCQKQSSHSEESYFLIRYLIVSRFPFCECCRSQNKLNILQLRTFTQKQHGSTGSYPKYSDLISSLCSVRTSELGPNIFQLIIISLLIHVLSSSPTFSRSAWLIIRQDSAILYDGFSCQTKLKTYKNQQ